MQTLVDTATGISHYVFNDGRTVTVSNTGTVVSATSEDKYKNIEELDGTNWTNNTDFKIICSNKCRTDNKITVNDYDATKCSDCGEDL